MEIENSAIRISESEIKKGVMGVTYVITDECVACGTCSEECPAEAIEEGEPYVINEEKCTECGSCFEVCPVEAIVEK